MNAKKTVGAQWMHQLATRRETLLIAIVSESDTRDFSEQVLAQQLEISESYLGELFCGASRVEDITRETAQSIAAFLGWPLIYAMMAAGQVRLEDFFTEETLEQVFADACKHWPELTDSPSLCAVLALMHKNETVVKRNSLRDAAITGMGYAL